MQHICNVQGEHEVESQSITRCISQQGSMGGGVDTLK